MKICVSGALARFARSRVLVKGDLQTIFRISYLKVYKLITMESLRICNHQEEK